ncbi:MAG: MarR family transcriptional regulator [Clostridia bacterium]|nr:MarR family transcriptional regulator [Clostridia bacterium]
MSVQEGGQRARTPVELILRAARAHKRVVERQIDGLGIHGGQHHMLMILSRLGQIPAQNELARRMDISPASAANMLKRLETAGYIQRRADAKDGRRNEVRITEKGGQVVERSRRIFEEVDRRMFEGFTDEETERLRSALERIHANLRGLEEEIGGQEELASPDEEGNETTH